MSLEKLDKYDVVVCVYELDGRYVFVLVEFNFDFVEIVEYSKLFLSYEFDGKYVEVYVWLL